MYVFEKLPPLKSLRAFEAAARLGSFTSAAKELSITQGAISYQIKRLETSLDVILFQRAVRQVSLTTAGESLYRTTHQLFRELEDEIHSIAPRQQPLLLTVSVSTFFVTRWLSQRLGHFLIEQPMLTLRLQHSVNDPDFSVDAVDLAIRWGKGNWSGVESELLIPSSMTVLCAPQLTGGSNPITRIDDLRQHTFLHDQTGNDSWIEWLSLAGLEDLGAGKGPIIVDPNVRVQSAIDGQGLVMANRLLEDDIQQGRLMEPFDIRLEGYGFYLVYAPEAKRRKAFQLFRSWVKEEAETYLISKDCQ
jgi:LysR family transcriptional regulator, glycine cleavage system transcriptional activator